MSIRAAALVGVAILALAGCGSSPSGSDLAGLVQARAQLCKYDTTTVGMNFDHATIIPNDQIPLGNTGEHPGDQLHYLRVPFESYTAQPGDTSAAVFEMTLDPQTGWSMSAGSTYWPSQCSGTDAEVKAMLISDPLQ